MITLDKQNSKLQDVDPITIMLCSKNNGSFHSIIDACKDREVAPYQWDKDSKFFSIIIPVPDNMADNPKKLEKLYESGVLIKFEKIKNEEGKEISACLVGKTIEPMDGKYFSAYALSKELDKDKSILVAALSVFSVANDIDFSMPVGFRGLLDGHFCLELETPSASTDQLEGNQAHLYVVEGKATLVIPFSEIPNNQAIKVLEECSNFLQDHGEEIIHFAKGTRKAISVQVPSIFYEDLKLFAAETLKLTIAPVSSASA